MSRCSSTGSGPAHADELTLAAPSRRSRRRPACRRDQRCSSASRPCRACLPPREHHINHPRTAPPRAAPCGVAPVSWIRREGATTSSLRDQHIIRPHEARRGRRSSRAPSHIELDQSPVNRQNISTNAGIRAARRCIPNQTAGRPVDVEEPDEVIRRCRYDRQVEAKVQTFSAHVGRRTTRPY